jgi:hypothetical protein
VADLIQTYALKIPALMATIEHFSTNPATQAEDITALGGAGAPTGLDQHVNPGVVTVELATERWHSRVFLDTPKLP